MKASGHALIWKQRYVAAQAEIERLRADRESYARRVIDETWGEALEDGSVPSTKLQDKILAAVDNQQRTSGK
jgi:hypothetical protein